MNKVSIIIPVYNTQAQIDRCLKSIVNQTYKNIETIVINDNSTDDSEEIILKYVNQYPNLFSYYKKENNTGLADTRNYGLTKASGDYVLFVDSDDYIDDDLIENLKKYMEKGIEVIKFKANIVNGKTTIIDGPVFQETDGQTAFDLLVFDDIMLDSACIYLFKRDIFVKKNFKFCSGAYHEDFGVVPLIVVSAKNVVSTNIIGYYYVQTNNSITRNDDYQKTIKRWEDSLLHYDNMLQYIRKFSLRKKTEENVKIYYTNAILLKLKSIHKEDRKEYIQQIKQRNMIKNIKVRDVRQLVKRVILSININLYLKLLK
ncbi:MAG: glycosyltransferase family 2 protein [Clostridia bacterium]|nr:glycosyltransferase family 2 protein [Clostridia bacterium]